VTAEVLGSRSASAHVQPRRSPLLPELVIVALLLFAYDRVRSFAHPRVDAALIHGRDLLRWERDLHIAVEHSANAWISGHEIVEWVASLWYQCAHITVTMALLGWLWWRHADLYRGARNALVLINLVGLVVFAVLPVMPPRLLPGEQFIDTIEAAGLGSAPVGPVPADQYAAMPSLHLAWAVWVAFYGALIAGPALLRWLWRIYPLVTASVVVVTANHYVLDIVAGVLLGALAVPLGSRLSTSPATNAAAAASTPGPPRGTRGSSPRLPAQDARGSADASAAPARARRESAEPRP
jgi:hypothetical protein